MKKSQTILVVLLSALFWMSVLPGIGSAQLKTVNVALAGKENPDNLPYFIGMRMGFFKEAGIDLKPSYFSGGGDVVRAITSGSASLAGVVAPSAIFIADSRGETVKIVSGNMGPPVGFVWVVKANSPLKSVRDLKGKKVGFSRPGSVTETALLAILKQEKLEKDVQMVPVGTAPDNWTAVVNGILDAGYHTSPDVYYLVSKKEARILFSPIDYLKRYQKTVVAAMEGVIKKEPETIRNFLRARSKAVKFIWSNPDKTIVIWAHELDLPVDVARLAYKDLPRNAFDIEAPKMENLRGSFEEAMGTGAIKVGLDLNRVLDMRFIPEN